MEPKDRIKEIYQELGQSQRGFAQSIGLKPTSLASVMSGRSGVSQLLANSIELKYGYSARWVMTGKGRKKSINVDTDDLYYAMLGCAAEALFGEFEIGAFAEKGIARWIEQEVEEKQEKYIRKVKKLFKDKGDANVLSEIAEKTDRHIRWKKKVGKLFGEALDELGSNGHIALVFRVYMEIIEERSSPDIQLSYLEIEEKEYMDKVFPYADQITKLIKKMYGLWE